MVALSLLKEQVNAIVLWLRKKTEKCKNLQSNINPIFNQNQ